MNNSWGSFAAIDDAGSLPRVLMFSSLRVDILASGPYLEGRLHVQSHRNNKFTLTKKWMLEIGTTKILKLKTLLYENKNRLNS
jgi:hypothetical protein